MAWPSNLTHKYFFRLFIFIRNIVTLKFFLLKKCHQIVFQSNHRQNSKSNTQKLTLQLDEISVEEERRTVSLAPGDRAISPPCLLPLCQGTAKPASAMAEGCQVPVGAGGLLISHLWRLPPISFKLFKKPCLNGQTEGALPHSAKGEGAFSFSCIYFKGF